MTKSLMVLVDGIDDTQRNLIHAQIKRNAEHWWHEMPDVWIVQTDESIRRWHTRLKVFVPEVPSFLLIFELPEGGPSRNWLGSGIRSKWKWIYENYALPDGRPPRPLEDRPLAEQRGRIGASDDDASLI